MNCCNCGISVNVKPLYRTNPKGQKDGGWMCLECIDDLHDRSLVDEGDLEIVKAITGGLI